MRISDWSSDVCSSDLEDRGRACQVDRENHHVDRHAAVAEGAGERRIDRPAGAGSGIHEGRAQQQQESRHEQPERSEEHTSELQSLMRISYAVFCLKKKTTKSNTGE